MQASIPIDRTILARRGRRLEFFTIGWNSIEAISALCTSILAGSAALVAFGLDSVMEVVTLIAGGTGSGSTTGALHTSAVRFCGSNFH